MKVLKNIIAAIFLLGFISSCLPHPGKKPMPPGHEKRVQELKDRHPSNR